jgi:hypothetical protein
MRSEHGLGMKTMKLSGSGAESQRSTKGAEASMPLKTSRSDAGL